MSKLVIVLALAMLGIAGCGAGNTHTQKTDEKVWIDPFGPGEKEGPVERVELDENAKLDDYLAYAAQNNPGLEAAFNRYQAAVERIAQAQALPDPRLSYRYYIREIETRVGAMRQGFTLAQTFPWLGKLELRGDAAAEAARAERFRFDAVRLKLFHEVKDAYYEYYYLSRSIAIVEENLHLVQQFEQVARTRYKAATASHPTVIRAQVELAKLEDRLASLRALRYTYNAVLNAALNRPTDILLPWPREISQPAYDFSDEDILLRLVDFNPELRALDAEFVAAQQRTDLAHKAYYPDVTLSVDHTNIAELTGGRSPEGDGKDAVAVMASVNLPIWYRELDAGLREAKFRERAVRRTRQQRSQDLIAWASRVLYEFHDAERKMHLYRDTLAPKAAEAVKTTLAAFRADQAGFTDLIDAQRVWLEFELAVERARVDRAQRLAELEMLVGQEISSVEKGPRHAEQD